MAQGFEGDEAAAVGYGDGGGGEGALCDSFMQNRKSRAEYFLLMLKGFEQRG